ncbi:hypothetical protein VSQ48_19880 [Candidatus Ventrimonas sp. KK005]
MVDIRKEREKNDDYHVHDQQMQKAAAKTRLWEACICDGLMDKQENRADGSEFRDEIYLDLNLVEP